MDIFEIIITAVYALLLVSYFFIEVGDNHKRRMAVKITLVGIYLLLAAVNLFTADTVSVNEILIALGLIGTAIGDVLLVIKDDLVWLKRGAYSFFVGNMLIAAGSVYYMVQNGFGFGWWWCFALYISLYARMLVDQKSNKLVIARDRHKLNIYIATVTLNGVLGLALLCYGGSAVTTLFGIGMCAFMLSDYFLVYYRYDNRKNWCLITNSGLYFTGLFLIALSLGL